MFQFDARERTFWAAVHFVHSCSYKVAASSISDALGLIAVCQRSFVSISNSLDDDASRREHVGSRLDVHTPSFRLFYSYIAA